MAETTYAFEKVITGTVGGLVIGYGYVWLVGAGVLPSLVLDFMKIMSVFAWFAFIRVVSEWSFAYLLGWAIGTYVVFAAGLLTDLDIVLYVLIVALGLWLKFKYEKTYEEYEELGLSD